MSPAAALSAALAAQATGTADRSAVDWDKKKEKEI
jgi:hypothetical protein